MPLPLVYIAGKCIMPSASPSASLLVPLAWTFLYTFANKSLETILRSQSLSVIYNGKK